MPSHNSFYEDPAGTNTGKSPGVFKKLAEQKGFLQKGKLKPGVKAGQIVARLKEKFELGYGHCMAIVACFKGKKSDEDKNSAL